jgi:hypothetical protein
VRSHGAGDRGEDAGAWLLPIHRHYNHGLPLAGAPTGFGLLVASVNEFHKA